MSHPFFDAVSFPWTHELARELHEKLYQAITATGDIDLRCKKCAAISLNLDLSPDLIWKEVLEKLTLAKKLHELCNHLLADRKIASIHPIVAQVLNCVSLNPIQREGKGAIGEDAVKALIGSLRQRQSERLLPLARIAHALLRNSLIPDRQGPYVASQHPIATIIQSLINDPVASSGNTHPAIRYCVLLRELCSGEREISDALWQWFQQHCALAGYEYEAILGELPTMPSASSRFFWLDIHWRDKLPGDRDRTANAYLRCGHLQYCIRSESSQLGEEAQFTKLVRSYRTEQDHVCPVNHVAAVTQRSKMLAEWELDSSTKELLPLPVTVREEIVNGVLKCPLKLDAETNVPWTSVDDLSLNTQRQGVFVTGKLDAVQGFPCHVFNALLNCAAVGIWTKGPSETDDDDQRLRDNTHVQYLFELPKLIHSRRAGAVAITSVWRRVVLYFNPNIPELIRDAVGWTDILQVNNQLN